MKLRPWSQSLALACILALSLLIFPHPLEAAPDSAGAVPTALVYFDDFSPGHRLRGPTGRSARAPSDQDVL